MNAIELVKNPPVTIGRNETLLRAKVLLREHGIRHLVVMEDAADYPKQVVGVLSERDLFLAAMSSLVASGTKAQDSFLDTVLVKEAMSAEVISARPDTPLTECAKVLKQHRIGCLPIIDGTSLVGVLTVTDFLDVAAEEQHG